MLKYGTYSIPYGTGAGAEAIDYFGFSLKKDGTYIIGSPAGMQRYSETAATVDTWGALDLGHVYDLYNLLKIPATAPVGDYATTGTSPNQHLMIEFI